MNILKEEREIFARYFPGLEQKLRDTDFEEREREGSEVVEVYRQAGGPALLIPKEYGGMGAGPVDAVAVHRMLGLLSPSLAIAATMHDFTAAFLAEYAMYGDATKQYLNEIAKDKLFLASGFAEGKSGANILAPTMRAVPVDGGYKITGAKKPCSVADSMDYLTASVDVVNADGSSGQRAIAIIPATAEGIERLPFWKVRSLGGAQSKEVRLTDVFIGEDCLFLPQADVPLDVVEAGGFLWFELLVTASYLGVANGLVERVYTHKRADSVERVRLLTSIELSAAALRGLAYEIQTNPVEQRISDSLVARMLMIRYGVQQQMGQVTYLGAELLGGMHFIGDASLEYTLSSCSALAFHPPSRLSISEAVDHYVLGGDLQMV
ncbi:MAG: acyl-CoA dehydrogenase family protein [Wenzhouxiangellaceae bacterium]